MPLTADRVKETTVATGTGSLVLAGAATGFRSFNAAFGLGPTFWYAVSSPGGSEWEVGIGLLTDSTTLVRQSVIGSSNAGAAVDFPAGAKDVFATFPGNALNDLVSAATTVYASLALTAASVGKRQALGASTEIRFTAAGAGSVYLRFTDASAAIGVSNLDMVVDCNAAPAVRLVVPGGLPFVEFMRLGASDVNFSLGLMR